MGLLSALGLTRKPSLTPTDLSLVSPWQPAGNLSQVTIGEIWGEDVAHNLPLDRSAAITVPAVSRARNLLVGHIMQYPLVALRDGLPLEDQPTFLYRTNGPVPPRERTAWTVDDLVFHGVSLWLTERGSTGTILDARWHPRADWRINAEGNIEARGDDKSEWSVLDEEDYILFNAPFDGLLNIAARTIRGALSTEEAWTGRMRNPIPLIELSVTDDSQLEPDEIEDQVKTWAKARTGINGAVSWTPPGMEVKDHGSVQADLYTEGRNAIRTDIGNFTNIPTSMMDGSLAEASLTYQTTEGIRNRFQVESIPFWTAPIEEALSMDKVVPAGQAVRFDKTQDYIPVPTATGAPAKD
ncbi:MAG: phage portal protein [Curtobacterium sp.]